MTVPLHEPRERTRPMAASALPRELFAIDKLIRFAHCDPAGQVFFPRWYDLLNEVAEDWFIGRLGLDYHGIIAGGMGLGSARIEADFFRPGLMGETIRFRVVVERIGTASFTMRIHGHIGEDEVLRARQVVVTSITAEPRAVGLPPALRSALEDYQERCNGEARA